MLTPAPTILLTPLLLRCYLSYHNLSTDANAFSAHPDNLPSPSPPQSTFLSTFSLSISPSLHLLPYHNYSLSISPPLHPQLQDAFAEKLRQGQAEVETLRQQVEPAEAQARALAGDVTSCLALLLK